MNLKYTGTDKEGKQLTKELNEALKRPQEFCLSNNKNDWFTCPECGKKVKEIFGDTGLCVDCDKENREDLN